MRRMLGITVVAVLSLLSASVLAQGPAGEYYLTAGDQQSNHVVQGNAVVRTAPQASGNREYPVAVLDDVRTLGGTPGEGGTRYSLQLQDLGDRYAFPNLSSAWDGTTDGTSHYVVDFGNGGVWKFDRNWQNGQQVFATPQFYLGITYDPSDDTMWVSQWNGQTVEHRDMSGNVLGSFDAGFSSISCLALDHSDDTLWMGSQAFLGTSVQFSKSGQRLGEVTYPELTGQNTLGGEFIFGGGGRCKYTISKSKAKGACQTCPSRGDDFQTQQPCEESQDCRKKVSTTINCPEGNGTCKIKAKSRRCE